MSNRKANAKKPETVTRPFVKGSPLDNRSIRDGLTFFGILIIATVLYMIVGSLLVSDMIWLRLLLSIALIGGTWALFFINGMNKGTAAVDYGEKLWLRQERGTEIPASERRRSYHPLKGFCIGLIGCLPVLIPALILALTAKRQMAGFGALPNWIGNYEDRIEIGAPLRYYHQVASLLPSDVIRIITRMQLMPYVSVIGAEESGKLLLLERLSPLLILLQPVCYGLGYTRGTAVRNQVHTDIAENNRKRKRREQKQLKARAAERKPTQLN